MIIQVLNKDEFKMLCEIRTLRQKLGFAQGTSERHLTDLEAERNRLRKLVRICYE